MLVSAALAAAVRVAAGVVVGVAVEDEMPFADADVDRGGEVEMAGIGGARARSRRNSC